MTWDRADQISDSIVDLLNRELKKPGCGPLDLLVGQMLALMALLKTAEGLPAPARILLVQEAISVCLDLIMDEVDGRQSAISEES